MAPRRGSTGMSADQMMQVQRELGAISQSLKNAEEYRAEVLKRLDDQNGKSDELSKRLSDKIDEQKEKIDALRGSLTNIESALKSTTSVVANIAVEKCGDRLDALEKLVAGFPQIESEVMFWRNLLGGTFSAVWKITLAVIGSGAVGGLIVHWTAK